MRALRLAARLLAGADRTLHDRPDLHPDGLPSRRQASRRTRPATNLGLARDWHYQMPKSGGPELRGGRCGAACAPGPWFEMARFARLLTMRESCVVSAS